MSQILADVTGSNRWYRDVPVLLIVASAIIFYLFTIRPGNDWGGDFALYIAHAKNIATGHPYADTGYVYNPNEPFLSPRSYPPVFPLVLSPVYAVFGLNLYAMKVANILVFAVFLLLFSRHAGQHLERRLSQLVLVAVVAFSPWFWNAKDSVLPDFTFLLCLYATILFVDRHYKVNLGTKSPVFVGISTALLVYLNYATRSVGMFLVPALILLDFIRLRKVRKATMIAAFIFFAAYYAQNSWLQIDVSYVDGIQSIADESLELSSPGAADASGTHQHGTFQCRRLCLIVTELISRIPQKVKFYGAEMAAYWENGYSAEAAIVVFVCVGLLAIIGFVYQLLRVSSLSEFFVVVYVMVLLVVPFVQVRYLLPIVPFYLLYAVVGLERTVTAMRTVTIRWPKIPNILLVAFLGVVIPSYAGKYLTYNSDEMVHGVESTDSKELFAFVRTTPIDSLLVFHKPRPLALFTGRRSVIYQWEPDADKLWNYLTGIGATHIIVPKYIATNRHNQHFMAMVDHYRSDLAVEFENGDFVVYRIVNG